MNGAIKQLEEFSRWNVGQSARMKRILADLEGKDSKGIIEYVSSYREVVAWQAEKRCTTQEGTEQYAKELVKEYQEIAKKCDVMHTVAKNIASYLQNVGIEGKDQEWEYEWELSFMTDISRLFS